MRGLHDHAARKLRIPRLTLSSVLDVMAALVEDQLHANAGTITVLAVARPGVGAEALSQRIAERLRSVLHRLRAESLPRRRRNTAAAGKSLPATPRTSQIARPRRATSGSW